MGVKDYFSDHSKIYAAFRPTYPEELYQFILTYVKQRSAAWDCGTGNGQVAHVLSKYFGKVYATDISRQQLDEAIKIDNIIYSVGAAEKTSFADGQFDLITVAQALHWFNTEEFFREVKRTLKPDGVLAVWGYALLTIDQNIDRLFMDFYNKTVGPYWDYARKLVDRRYTDIHFPFEEIPSPEFCIKLQWSKEQFAGYLTSWSATQKFWKTNGFNPVDQFMRLLSDYWQNEEIKPVTFPVFLKIGTTKRQ